MKPSLSWIEDGPDGRRYFVRPKSNSPTTRELLSNALAPFKDRSYSFTESILKNRSSNSRQLATPLSLTISAASTTVAKSASVHGIQSPKKNKKMPVSMNTTPSAQPRQAKCEQSNSRTFQNIPVPQSQHYLAPHPDMIPVNPAQMLPNLVANHIPCPVPLSTLPPPMSFVPQPQQIPTHPVNMIPLYAKPADSRRVNGPFPTPTDVTRYECCACGRVRSTRFHLRHPVPPGQLPGKTICRKCRKDLVDSEDEARGNHSGENFKQHRSVSHGRPNLRQRITQQVPRPRIRSMNHIVYLDDDDNRHDNDCSDDYSATVPSLSSPPDIHKLKVSNGRNTFRRHDSSDTYTTHHYIGLAARPEEPEGIPQRFSTTHGNQNVYRSSSEGVKHELAPRQRSSYRPASAHQAVHWTYVSPETRPLNRADMTAETRVCSDTKGARIPLLREESLRARSVSPPTQRRANREISSEEESDSEPNSDSSNLRPRSKHRTSEPLDVKRRQGRGRIVRLENLRYHNSEYESDLRTETPSPLAHEPYSPASYLQSYLSEPNRAQRGFSSRLHKDYQPEGRARRKSEHMPLEKTYENRHEVLPPRDRTQRFREHRSGALEDYDWYDDKGNWVRVREI